jgi:hypothetical protein
MILDLKRFTPGQDLPPGLLWVRHAASLLFTFLLVYC